MIKAVKHCLSHLMDFSGRDSRQVFWFYVLFLVVVQYALGLAIALPMMVSMFSGIFGAIRSGVEDEAALQSAMLENMTGYLEVQMWFSLVIGLVMTFLVAAAFVRRLHDAGYTGWIALAPIGFQLFALFYTQLVFDDVLAAMGKAMDPANGMNAFAVQAEVAPWAMLGYVGYLIVIGFGVLKSQDGPNQYGEEPVRF